MAIVGDDLFEVRPLDTIVFDGSASTDPDGEELRPTRYRWTIIERPMGSTSQIGESFVNPAVPTAGVREDDFDTPTAVFFVDLAGSYLFGLEVIDADGALAPSDECPSPDALVRVEARFDEGLTIELTWETPGDFDQADDMGTDVDLLLLHPEGEVWQAPLLCYYANASPDWGVVGEVADNPSLDIDDTNGAGPEIISLRSPQDTDVFESGYRIGVHYYRSDDQATGMDYGESVARLRIFSEGELAYEAEQILLTTDAFWEAAMIFNAGGELRIEPVDEVSGMRPE